MRRLTKTDWRVINSALALYEAADPDEFGITADDEKAEETHFKKIQHARLRVWERLKDDV